MNDEEDKADPAQSPPPLFTAPVLFKAESGGRIDADGAFFDGMPAVDQIASAETGGEVSMNGLRMVAAKSQAAPPPRPPWYQRPFGIIMLAAVAGLIVAAIAYYAHWAH